jgi:hypothetical protein
MAVIDHSLWSAPSGSNCVYLELSVLPMPSLLWLESKRPVSVMSMPQVHLCEVAGRDCRCLSSALACCVTQCGCLVTDYFDILFVRWSAGADANATSDG